MRDYDSLIDAGNKAQIEKLEENSHKKGFENINLSYAFHRLQEEMDELSNEIYDNLESGGRIEEIRREAADIANFAHMIIYKCDQELSN